MGGEAMYTGEMIDDLIADVQHVEALAFVRITQAKRPLHVVPNFNTYIFEFGRSEAFGSGPQTIEVA
jgi:hypothetical protein